MPTKPNVAAPTVIHVAAPTVIHVAAPFRVRIKEKKHRLPLDNYIGEIVIAFTICTLDREKDLTTEYVFSSIEKILLDCLEKSNCEALAYLFMPDHCHLLLRGKSPSSNLWRCMINFKQKSGYWFSKNNTNIKWQKDFYDHILRKDEDLKKHVLYILNNPVRKGTVDYWKEHKFMGYTTYDFKEWL